jgi:hypothetical protein
LVFVVDKTAYVGYILIVEVKPMMPSFDFNVECKGCGCSLEADWKEDFPENGKSLSVEMCEQCAASQERDIRNKHAFAKSVIAQCLTHCGFSAQGPADHKGAKSNGEPIWVANARAALADL